jgi:hypothetical protein
VKKLAFVALVGLIISVNAWGQTPSPVGTWRGVYQPLPVQVPFVVQIARTSAGWSAKTQSPNQNANFFPVDSVSVESKHVTFVQSQYNILFSATLSGNSLSGTFSQAGVTNKVFLVRITPDGATCSGSDALAGEWRGTVEYTPAGLPFVLSVAGAGVNLGATTQTPSVNPTSFPVDSINYSGSTLSFKQMQFGVEFVGNVSGDTLSGTMTQNGYKNSMTLRRQ